MTNRTPDLVIVAAGIGSLGALAYAAAGHQTYLQGPSTFVAYYLTPAITAIACLACAFISPQARTNASLTIASVVFSLVLFEGFLYALDGNVFSTRVTNSNARSARAAGADVDFRDKITVISELRAQGVDAYPAYYPGALPSASGDVPATSKTEIAPVAGISLVTTVLCNESGTWSIYSSDEHGFRNPEGLLGQGRVTAVIIGDSFTHGSCVADGDTIADVMREHGSSVLNLGLANTGPLAQLAVFREYVEPIRPETVYWIYYEGNDALDLRREFLDPGLRRYLEPTFSQNLLERQTEIDRFHRRNMREVGQSSTAFSTLAYIAKLTNVRRRLGLSYQSMDTAPSDTDLDRLRMILTTAKHAADTWAGKIVMVYLPEWSSFANSGEASGREKLLALLASLQIETIDLAAELTLDGQTVFDYLQYGNPGNHFSADGYRRIAEVLNNRLRDVSGGAANSRL